MSRDPYWVGSDSHLARFAWKKTFRAKTDCGFEVEYTISCHTNKFDPEAFRAGRMLDENNQKAFVEVWHDKIFLPKFNELNYCFKYLLPWSKNYLGNPCLCRTMVEDGEEFFFFDFDGFEIQQELKKAPVFTHNGCAMVSAYIHVEDEHQISDELVEENYNMMKVKGLKSPENDPIYRHWEEALIIKLLHRNLELEKEFHHGQTNQEHTSKMISIKTRMVGRVVEVSWKLQNSSSEKYTLRGYRKEGGFAPQVVNLSDNGTCIVETKSNDGKSIQNMTEDSEYFFTFLVTYKEMVYAEQTLGDTVRSLIGSPVVLGTQTEIADSLRFSIRIPTQEEIQRVDRMLLKLGQQPVNPEDEFLQQAIKTLTSFVEFDGTMSQVEKLLTKQIEANKGYSDDEKQDKIERLRGAVKTLCIKKEDKM